MFSFSAFELSDLAAPEDSGLVAAIRCRLSEMRNQHLEARVVLFHEVLINRV